MRHREDRWDGVDGEDDVGDFDEHEHGQQRRGHEHAVATCPEFLSVVVLRRGHEALEEPEGLGLRGVDVLVALHQHPDAGEDEEGSEDVEDPREAGDEDGACCDEDRPEDQGTDHAVEEHAVLVLPGHREVAEDHGPDEDVVDRQGLLDDVAGEVLEAEFGAVGPPDDPTDRDGHRDPDARPDGGFLNTDDVGIAMHEEVDREHREDAREERAPDPECNVHVSRRGSQGRTPSAGSHGPRRTRSDPHRAPRARW